MPLVTLALLSQFPSYCHLQLKTSHWKLRPNRCRWRHGYYCPPIKIRQRPIRWYHRRLPTTYRLATIRDNWHTKMRY